MYRYIIKRVLLVIPTLVGAAALVFLLMRLIPGDICGVRLGSGGGRFYLPAVTGAHARLPPEPSVFLRFFRFARRFFRGDFVASRLSCQPGAHRARAPFP